MGTPPRWGTRSPGRDAPYVLSPRVHRRLKVPGLSAAASQRISVSLGGDMPLWGGAPLIESAPGRFLGPHRNEGPSTRLKRPACAGESDWSSNDLAAWSLSLPLSLVPTVQGGCQYPIKHCVNAESRVAEPGDGTPSSGSSLRVVSWPLPPGSPHYFNSEIPVRERPARGYNPARPRHPLNPEMPEPTFRRGKREVSGKAAPPPLAPLAGRYKRTHKVLSFTVRAHASAPPRPLCLRLQWFPALPIPRCLRSWPCSGLCSQVRQWWGGCRRVSSWDLGCALGAVGGPAPHRLGTLVLR